MRVEPDCATGGHSGDKGQKENLEIATCGISFDKVLYFRLTALFYVPRKWSVGRADHVSVIRKVAESGKLQLAHKIMSL